MDGPGIVDSMHFPEFGARSLQGAEKLLPADLPADRTLVILAFQQRHQRDVDAWMDVAERRGWLTDLASTTAPPTADTALPGRPTHAAIEVPCISKRWGPVRRFIDGGMATGIRVPTVLARTWTTYTDVGRIQRALGIADSASIWVGVVASDGEVLAQTLGPPTEESEAPIAAAMGGHR